MAFTTSVPEYALGTSQQAQQAQQGQWAQLLQSGLYNSNLNMYGNQQQQYQPLSGYTAASGVSLGTLAPPGPVTIRAKTNRDWLDDEISRVRVSLS